MREAGTSGHSRTAIGHGMPGLPQTLGCHDPGSKPPRPKRSRPRSENSSACSPKPEQPHSHDVSYRCATTAARSASHRPDAGPGPSGLSASGTSCGQGDRSPQVIKRQRTANAICVEPDQRSGHVGAGHRRGGWHTFSEGSQAACCLPGPLGRGRPRSYRASPKNGNAASAARQLRSSSATPMSPVNSV
jgi:hypothetical protein